MRVERKKPAALREASRTPSISADSRSAVMSVGGDAGQIVNLNYDHDERRASYKLATHTYLAVILAVMLICSIVQTCQFAALVSDVKQQTRDIRKISEMKYNEHIREYVATPPHTVTQNQILPTILPTTSYNTLE